MGSAHPRGRSAHPLREDGHAHDGRHRDVDRPGGQLRSPPGSRRDGPRASGLALVFAAARVRAGGVRRRLHEGAPPPVAGAVEVAEVPGHRGRLGGVRRDRGALLRFERDHHEPVVRARHRPAPRGLLPAVVLPDADGVLERREPHRRSRRVGGGLDDARALGLRLHRLLAVPSSVRRRGGVRPGLLRGERPGHAGYRGGRRGDDGRGGRVPVVERRPCAHLHGRHGLPGDRWVARGARDHHEHAAAAGHPGRAVRDRDDVGDPAGRSPSAGSTAGSSGCRRSTTISSWRAGRSSR